MDEKELFEVTKKALDGYKNFIEYLQEENKELKKRKNANCEELEEKLEKVKEELKSEETFVELLIDNHKRFLGTIYSFLADVYGKAEIVIGNPVVKHTIKSHEALNTVVVLLAEQLKHYEEEEARREEEKTAKEQEDG